MNALNSQQLTANAYRILGLPADATQADIDAAARRMRLWNDPRQIPPTPWDLRWMGPVPRRRDQIEAAAVQLHDPPTRIEHRIFWLAADSRSGVGTPHTAHDAAVTQLQRQFATDPKMLAVAGWAGAMSALIAAAKSDAYSTWFAAVERQGNFEKQVRPLEIQFSLDGLQEQFLASIVQMARDALELDRFDDYDRALQAMATIAAGADSAMAHYKEIGDRLEDLLVARCNRMADAIHRGINWDRLWVPHIRANTKFCERTGDEAKRSIWPLMQRFLQVNDAPLERRKRVSLPVARMLRNLGVAWGRTRNHTESDGALAAALQWTSDAALSSKITSDRQEIFNRLVLKRKKTKGKNPAWALIVLAVLGLRGLTSISSSDNSSSSDPSLYTPPRSYQVYPPLSPPIRPQRSAPPTFAPAPYTPPRYTPAPHTPAPSASPRAPASPDSGGLPRSGGGGLR